MFIIRDWWLSTPRIGTVSRTLKHWVCRIPFTILILTVFIIGPTRAIVSTSESNFWHNWSPVSGSPSVPHPFAKPRFKCPRVLVSGRCIWARYSGKDASALLERWLCFFFPSPLFPLHHHNQFSPPQGWTIPPLRRGLYFLKGPRFFSSFRFLK